MTRILIIEDSPTQAQRLQITLEEAGFQTEIVANGKEGLEKLSTSQFGVVISDIIMPGLSGYQVCSEIKSNPATADTPVILLTSLADPMDVIRALECGADHFITKPYKGTLLIKRINDVLAAKEFRAKHRHESSKTAFFLGQKFTITSNKEQILGLLLSTFEDIVQTNNSLRESQVELERNMVLLRQEQLRSESLLLNVLPRAIAGRLKDQTQVIADKFSEATILFADVVDFTSLCVSKTPEEVLSLLNNLFSRFDRLIDTYGLEKIKTIGDAYMVAAGLPTPRSDHAAAMADLALDFMEELANYNVENRAALSLRIGMSSGPVIAGVIGTRKFLYDLWGDAVNTASRMEAHGVVNGIQVSASTYTLLQDQFVLENRGPIQIKGKGEMTTYLLKKRKASGGTVER